MKKLVIWIIIFAATSANAQKDSAAESTQKQESNFEKLLSKTGTYYLRQTYDLNDIDLSSKHLEAKIISFTDLWRIACILGGSFQI
jgi:hypothetical protein